MKWMILIKKTLLGFMTGGTAAVVGQTSSGTPPTSLEGAIESGIVGLFSALMVGVTNYLKFKDK